MILGIFLMLAQPAQQPNIGDQMAAMGRAMDQWKICAATNARKYALATKEPAASVVEAAIGECSADLNAVRYSLMGFSSSDETDRTIKFLLDEWRPNLMAGVFRLRSAPRKK